MKLPIIPNNEKERLKDLESYGLIGLIEQDEYDFLTSMASRICETKISLISLITDEKQWFLSHHGLEARETPKDFAFCAHAINNPKEPFIIEDSRLDERFHDNPLATGEPHVIFYAGIPLISSSGFPLGTLCVIDDSPKKLSEKQIDELKKLARLATELFEKRKNEAEKNRLITELNKKNELLEETQKINRIGIWELDTASGKTIWNDVVYEIHEVPKEFDHNKVNGIEFYHRDYQKAISDAVGNCITHAIPFDLECILITGKKNQKWVRATGRKVGDKLIGSFQDISRLKFEGYKKQLIIEGTNVGTWEWDIETGEVIINDRYAEILGYKKEELQTANIETWNRNAHPDDLKKARELTKKCIKKELEYYQLEMRHKHKAGHWVWVNIRGKILEWSPSGQALKMYGTNQDITVRKEAEQEEKRRTILLESAQRIAKMGAWELDLTTGKTFWTDEVYNIHEVSKDFDHNKANGIEFYHPDYRPIITKAITDSIEKQTTFDVKCRFITAKNNLRWVRSSGYPIINEGKVTYLIGMFIDITEEEEAKEAIIREQSFSKQLLENMAEGFSVVDIDGKQLGVNKAFCEMTGFSEEELLGQTAPYPYWPEEEIENIGKAFQETLGGKLSSFELTFKKKNEERFPVLLSTSTLLDGSGNPISYFANITDITERKKYEQELTKAKEFLFKSGQVAKVGGWDYNNLTGEITWSETTCDIHEVPHGFVPTFEQMASFYIPESWIKLQKAVEEAINNGVSFDLELRIITAKGNEIWVRAIGNGEFKKGECVRLFGVLQEITFQKEAEFKIIQSKEQYESLVQNIPGITYRCLYNKNWTTLYLSNQVDSITGYTAEELVNSAKDSYGILIHPDDQEMVTKAVNEGVENNKAWEIEYRVMHKDGCIRWVFEKGNAVKNNKNEVLYLDGFILDITRRKKAQEEVKQLLSISEEQNKRLKNFAYIVSHNLKSHSTGISGILGLMKLDYPEIADNELFSPLESCNQNLIQTVDELTEIVEANTKLKENERILICKVIEKNINSLIFQLRNTGLKVINEVPKNFSIKGVPAYIDSMILNMITNAIKYRDINKESYLKIYCKEDINSATIYFEDNGIGIDLKKYRNKIFGMYNTFHQNSDSRGIGLYITKNQIESMGGEISLESEVNLGTTFKVTFRKK
jgi:PAS domain S-box-containing protein